MSVNLSLLYVYLLIILIGFVYLFSFLRGPLVQPRNGRVGVGHARVVWLAFVLWVGTV